MDTEPLVLRETSSPRCAQVSFSVDRAHLAT